MSAGHTLLLVEDDPDDVFHLKRAYKKAGLAHPLYVVADGQQAIDYLAGVGPYADRARHPLPTLMLLDLKLPRRSGLEVLAWVRAQPALRRLPIIALTSSRERADVNGAYDLCVNSYLVKPLDAVALCDLMGRIDAYWLDANESPDGYF